MYTQQELIDKLTPVFRQYPIKRAALFGSYARGEQTDDSDLDIILELDYTKEPYFIYLFWDVLEDTVNLRADVLTLCSLRTAPESFRNEILNEMRYIYEA